MSEIASVVAACVIFDGESDGLHCGDDGRSPMTVIMVVDVVGVIPSGHTSGADPVKREMSAAAARGLSWPPVMTIKGISG